MSVLLLAEHDGKTLNISTRKALSACMQLGAEVEVLVAGSEGAAEVAKQAAVLQGVSKVKLAVAPHYANALAEEIAPLLVREAKGCSHLVAAATTTGKDILPRVAARLDAQQVSDITAIHAPDTFTRPIYAGNAFETVQSSDAVKVLTVRPTQFDATTDGGNAPIEEVAVTEALGISRFVSADSADTGRPDLASASRVVSGGRGLGSEEGFKQLEALADLLGAAIGASRAAVDAGYAPNDWQVGQTGKIVAPELYIAIGISGAIQHIAGMKDSKVIVAINKDENAPIFDVADYGLVGDLFSILPELKQALK